MPSPPYTELVEEVVELSNQAEPPEMDASLGINSNHDQQFEVNPPSQNGNSGNFQIRTFGRSAAAPVVYSEYKAGQSKFLGVVQIFIGLGCIVFSQIAFSAIGLLNHSLPKTRLPHQLIIELFPTLWIISGCFGIYSGSVKTPGAVITFLVLSIINAVGTGIIVILIALDLRNIGILAALYSDPIFKMLGRGIKKYFTDRLVMYTIFLILFVLEEVCAIWGSILGCQVACCGAKATTPPQPITVVSENINQQATDLAIPNPVSGPIYPTGYPSQPLTLNTGNLNAAP